MQTALATSWPTLGAWGAALVQLALGAGMATGTDTAARAAGIVLVALGLIGLGWGALRLARARSAGTDRVGIGLAVAGVISTAAALAVDAAHTSVLAVVVGAALWTMVGVTSAIGVRTRPRNGSPPTAPEPRHTTSRRARIAGIAIGAIVVAGAVTPALASTEAGRLAPDHHLHDPARSDLHRH